MENSKLWSRKKYYEYIMQKFDDKQNDEEIPIDRTNLYYFYGKKYYSIFDLKNGKIYCYKSGMFSDNHKEYKKIFGINIENYSEREIYSVKGGPQEDGNDYYVYKFNHENGENIVKEIENNNDWTKEKLDEEKLNDFIHNREVINIKNGYYHFKLVCRTSNLEKQKNFIPSEATGWEIGVYDVDNDVFYYYWESI